MATLLLALVLLVVACAGIFYTPPANYTYVGRGLAALCVLLLFLIAIGVLKF